MAGQPKKNADLMRLRDEPDLGEQILEAMGGGMTMTAIYDLTGISKAAVLEWVEQDTERAARASRARARAAHALVDESIEIADKLQPVEKVHDDGTVTVVLPSADEVRAAKLRTQVRQWAAERWNRSAYGQKVEVSGQIDVQHLHLQALQRRHRPQVQDVVDVEPKTLEQQLLEL